MHIRDSSDLVAEPLPNDLPTDAAGDEPAPVTVIGLGLMGSALAGAFLANGNPTTVWNRSAEKADSLAAQGARRAATVADAVMASRWWSSA